MIRKLLLAGCCLLSACTSLTYQEKTTLRELQMQGITVDTPVGGWSAPASPATAGLLNLLPGVGNFYLASGNAAHHFMTVVNHIGSSFISHDIDDTAYRDDCIHIISQFLGKVYILV